MSGGTPAIPAWIQILVGIAFTVAASFAIFGASLRGPFPTTSVSAVRSATPAKRSAAILGHRGPAVPHVHLLDQQPAKWTRSLVLSRHQHSAPCTEHGTRVLDSSLAHGARQLVASRRPGTLALFGAALFLVHPLQAESVAYIASRSETLADSSCSVPMRSFFITGSRVWAGGRRSACCCCLDLHS